MCVRVFVYVYFEVMICQHCYMPLASSVRKITDPRRVFDLFPHTLSLSHFHSHSHMRPHTPIVRSDEVQLQVMATWGSDRIK